MISIFNNDDYSIIKNVVNVNNNTTDNDYLIMKNVVDYERIFKHIYLYIDVYTNDNNNTNDINDINDKYSDKLGNLNVQVRNVITNNNDNYKPDKSYYYILDTNETAFAHWIYDSCIFIQELIELNKTNNNIKILTKNNRKYIKSFLRFFNINNEIVNSIDNYNNITYSPLIISLNFTHKNPETDKYFNYHLDNYINYIISNVINITPYINKCVFLPRNDIDNVADYHINNKDIIKEIIINNGGIVLDTYHLNNIKYQFSILNNSDIIIIDYGSSFLVNCAFLKNKKIYVINNHHNYHLQMQVNPYLNYIVQTKILNNNYIELISTNQLDLINNISKPP
jgi:hypothetical protein